MTTSPETKRIIGRLCEAALRLGWPSRQVEEKFGVSRSFLRKYANWRGRSFYLS